MPYYNDDGTEFNPDLIPRPALCCICSRADTDDEFEEILCNLTRLDQQYDPEFICHAFRRYGATDIDLPN